MVNHQCFTTQVIQTTWLLDLSPILGGHSLTGPPKKGTTSPCQVFGNSYLWVKSVGSPKFKKPKVQFLLFILESIFEATIFCAKKKREFLNTVVKISHFFQGSLDYPNFRGIKQYKSMVNSRNFPIIVHCLGWLYNDPCFCKHSLPDIFFWSTMVGFSMIFYYWPVTSWPCLC